ncbi:MAG: lysophospholipid acyltransferase family protein [Myxococcota bacterium]|nr:lysophospholipid acyltransferase family protein [Myxococcota bacterium]
MHLLRTARNYFYVAAPAIPYGLISIGLGPLSDRSVSAWAMRRWFQAVCDGLGITRELQNGHLLDAHKQCIFVSNHNSLLDTPVLGSLLDGDYRWLAKSSIFHVPFIGWHLSLAGHIPVYRGKSRGRNRELPELLHEAIAQGASLLFFPEGTRSPDAHLQPFKMGAFMTAARENLPIVPLTIEGTETLLSKGRLDIDPHARDKHCRVTVLEAIFPNAQLSEEDAAEQLREQVWEAMATQLGQYDAPRISRVASL